MGWVRPITLSGRVGVRATYNNLSSEDMGRLKSWLKLTGAWYSNGTVLHWTCYAPIATATPHSIFCHSLTVKACPAASSHPAHLVCVHTNNWLNFRCSVGWPQRENDTWLKKKCFFKFVLVMSTTGKASVSLPVTSLYFLPFRKSLRPDSEWHCYFSFVAEGMNCV